MTMLFEKIILAPIRLQPQPELEVEFVPLGLQQRWGRIQTDQAGRLSPEETQAVMKVLDRSVGKIGRDGPDGSRSLRGW